MYCIERRPYGFRLGFSGIPDLIELQRWHAEASAALEGVPEDFGVVVDLREVQPVPSPLLSALLESQRLFKTRGMLRSAVMVSGRELRARLEGVARATRIYRWERYFDASNERCEQAALDWVVRGLDPDWRL